MSTCRRQRRRVLPGAARSGLVQGSPCHSTSLLLSLDLSQNPGWPAKPHLTQPSLKGLSSAGPVSERIRNREKHKTRVSLGCSRAEEEEEGLQRYLSNAAWSLQNATQGTARRVLAAGLGCSWRKTGGPWQVRQTPGCKEKEVLVLPSAP